MRRISYNDAIREAIKQSMEEDKSVFVYGEGVDFAKGVFGIPLDLAKEFGDERVLIYQCLKMHSQALVLVLL